MNTNLAPFALLENTLDSKACDCYYFDMPVCELIANDAASLQKCLGRIPQLQQQELYLVGYISYEAAYYLNPVLFHLQSPSDPKPLLHFTAFKNMKKYSTYKQESIPMADSGAISLMYDRLDKTQYQRDFDYILTRLGAGDSYQVNFTKRIALKSTLNSQTLYQQIKKRQAVRFSAYLPFLPKQILSFSPELFFKKQDDRITVKPMKGTSARFSDPQKDHDSYEFLKHDGKNRAENLIIIDLLRNDLAKICDSGSVEVSKPFQIEAYQSVYQMISTIEGRLDQNIELKTLLENLFPCGSITGAPKRRTIEIIHELEPPRGVYTGSIGYILPNNDMCFSVAIRTIEIENNRLQFGVGGGFTIQSNQQEEWQEMRDKLHFIHQNYRPQFHLIESLYAQYHHIEHLPDYMARLNKTADSLCWSIEISGIQKALTDYALTLPDDNAYKVRIEISHDGSHLIEHSKIIKIDPSRPVELFICPEPIDSTNPLFQHKTDDDSTRGFYTAMHEKYLGNRPHSELIFINELGHITESRFHNILVIIEGQCYTPPVEDGLLPGIARQLEIKQDQACEKSLTVTDLKSAESIYLINSIRGKNRAKLSDQALLS
ncbi:MAG: aminodeoxychorismate synthase component I [Francisellaceae bacterium]